MTKFPIEIEVLEAMKSGKPFAVATLIKSEGSTPRHVGAKMIIWKDKSKDTIGGGVLENNVLIDSREMLLNRQSSSIKTYDLQACGGKTEIFIETHYPKDKLIIFGAGHVAKTLVPLAIESGFAVDLIDFRDDWLNLNEYANTNKTKIDFNDAEKINTTSNDYIIIMTPDHQFDETVLRKCLKKDYKYLGLMSSKHKWTLIKQKLIKDKFDINKIENVKTPIGININSETPIEIAISIMAELIKIRSNK